MWKSLCVSCGEGDMHRRGLIFLLDREQTCSSFRPCFVKRISRQLLYSLFGILQPTCVPLSVVVIV